MNWLNTIKLNLMVLMVVVKLRIEEERQMFVVEGHYIVAELDLVVDDCACGV